MSILVGSLSRTFISNLCSEDESDSFSYARIALDVNGNLIKNTMYLEKSNQPLTTERLNRLSTAVDPIVSYHIVQTQNGSCRLPAMSDGSYLWLIENQNSPPTIDPQKMLEDIIKNGFKTLEAVQEDFAGVLLLDDRLYYFSTPACPLFISWSDGHMTVSSEKFGTLEQNMSKENPLMTCSLSNSIYEIYFAPKFHFWLDYRFRPIE